MGHPAQARPLAQKLNKRNIMREIITLECTECKRRNYTTTKNKRLHPGRVEFKKYCRWDKKHTIHKETK
jgi:large subunit ribosomal protein L33